MNIKVRYDDFSLATRRHTSAVSVRDADDIASRAAALLERKKGGKGRCGCWEPGCTVFCPTAGRIPADSAQVA